ncbi:ParB/RepB/Spo0J family partition protein [Streptomyces sp. NPDC048508]|uniref:ParB/RepB/Spo0J family partition protein n=1 Tax=Streptomyces sp. NPDC048508 TaxID=3365561 RepID=UPI00371BF8A1
MKAADRLGTGSSFGNVPRGRSDRGRAKAITQGDIPVYELVRLQLSDVSPTPLNPRRNFGTPEELTRFGEELRAAQLAACVAVSRDVYLNLWPDHAEHLGNVKHVLVNGERRYRAACQVSLDALDFVVRDELAATRETFINHLLKENLDRADFDIIERARGINELVAVCAEESERGARARAAEHLGKDRSWITHQLSLLELPETIQAMLSSGDLPERDGRLLVRQLKDHPGLTEADLLLFLKDQKAARSAEKDAERALLAAARSQTQNHAEPTGTSAAEASGDVAAQLDGRAPTAPPSPAAGGTGAKTPHPAAPRAAAGASSQPTTDTEQQPTVLPAQNPERPPATPSWPAMIEIRDIEQVADALAAHLPAEDLTALTELLLERLSTKVQV